MTKIVLVEDDSELRAKHQTYLVQQGYEVMLSEEASVLELVCDVQLLRS
ncbi:hypothetical protein [uncultured Photobacterium sp.]|nr:hypothetical protein [uncultured Photobacterium sp.]